MAESSSLDYSGEHAGESSADLGSQLMTPLSFATDVLGVSLWDKQKEVLEALPGNRRIAVKSGNGLGKGFCAGVAALWFLYTHNPATRIRPFKTLHRQVQSQLIDSLK